jgi:NADH-quinone oxidoreductase subunit L
MNNNILALLLILPLIALVLVFFADNKQEKFISLTAISTTFINLLIVIGTGLFWANNGFKDLLCSGPNLYKTANAHFSIGLFFDGISFVYLFVASLLTLLVAVFSRFYMHREKGYKRFFSNLLFFFLGLNVILLSDNLETLFIGWEIIGVTSFFLIAFYRDRYLPVKNALKVISLYRVADAAMLLGIWMCHHYFHESISFDRLEMFVAEHVSSHDYLWAYIPFVFLIAAMVKSAQFPFSSWLPRAMEGPSTSSAIFYGALSVHIGVFLLIRIYPIWENQMAFRVVLAMIGLGTSIITSMIARVQSTVKTQIAYSSIAQIGIMFVEVALGWHYLALFHFAANAFLRCYQLLVSPSVLSYMIHDQFFNFTPPQHNISANLWGKLKLTFFALSVKEWNLDYSMFAYLWTPLKKIGKAFQLLDHRVILSVFGLVYFAGLYLVYHKDLVPNNIAGMLPEIYSILGFILISLAFVERKSANNAWLLIVLNQLYTSLSIGLNEQFDYTQVHIFLSGIIISSMVGFWCIYKLRNSSKIVDLNQFHGHAYEHPRLAFLFVICCLGLAGFPITPTFIGEDLLMGHIHENQIFLTIITSLNFILDGFVVYRIYARLFMGPHEEGYHEVAYKSS